MSKLPRVKTKDVLRVLVKLDFTIVRQRGSHIRLAHTDGRRVTVPNSTRPLTLGTLHSILRQTELTRQEFLKLLK